jgi:hypothetical protein
MLLNGPRSHTSSNRLLVSDLYSMLLKGPCSHISTTTPIGSLLKFWFQPYIERPNPTPYVARASILVKSGSGIRGGVEVELLTSLECTWRSNCHAHALVIGPCIVCKGEMSSSAPILLVQLHSTSL